VWGARVTPDEGTEVLARDADQFYAGAAAVTQKKHARGAVTYCGLYPAQAEFVHALFEKLARQIGLPITPLPPRVHLLKRGRYQVLLNYQDKSVEAPAPANAKFAVGERCVMPAGVAVWEEFESKNERRDAEAQR
jgi:beta-galactosidase GanA